MIFTLSRSRAISDKVATCSLLLTLAVLIIIGFLSYSSTGHFLKNDLLVEHTYQVLGKLDAILADLKDAETGQRGYLLTGDPSYLKPYLSGTAAVQSDTQTLRLLTRDNTAQQHRIDVLQSLAAAKMAELGQTISLRHQVGPDAALKIVKTGRGKALMNQIEVVITQIRSVEQRLLVARTKAAEAAGETARLWGLSGSALAVLLIINSIGFVSRYLRQRERAEAESLRMAEAARDAAVQQRIFLKDVLASVTEGRLALCDTANELPVPPLQASEPISLSAISGLRGLRQAAIQAARTCSFSEERTQDLATSVSEAGMNAVTHGGGGNAIVYTDGQDHVQVWITDKGTGIALGALPQSTLERGYSSAGSLGHGFWLMLRMCDRVSLLTGPNGTTMVLDQAKTAQEAPWLRQNSDSSPLTFKTVNGGSESSASDITNLLFWTRIF